MDARVEFPLYYQQMRENPQKAQQVFSVEGLDSFAKGELSPEEQDIFAAFYERVTIRTVAQKFGWKISKVNRYIKRIEDKIGMTPIQYWTFRNTYFRRK